MNFDDVLRKMREENASDVFVSVGIPIMLKVNGELQPLPVEPLTEEMAMSLVKGTMTEAQQKEFDDTHECNYAIFREGIGRFRVSAFVQRDMPGMVLRKIETKIPTIESLRLPAILKELSLTKRGLIIFVGGTGTGKSTSLASMIGYRNQTKTGHIITIEDPIEYVHQHGKSIITQREVGMDTESFEVALKNTLRQAPDVILIGEIRTRETMEHAVAFAETGHLCLATLHANNANQALDRIINFFPSDRHTQVWMDLSLNLKGMIAQQLIPTKDGMARRAAIEIMLNSPLMIDLIRKGAIHEIKPLMAKSRELGMQTFDQALYQLFNEGEISYEDAIRHADSPNDLRLMIKLKNETHADVLEDETKGLTLEDYDDEDKKGGTFGGGR
jgi:twitching motility protein PilU